MAETLRPPRTAGFIAGLGIAQIVSWGTLYYSFPLIAGPMSASLGLDKVQIYGAASLGLASGAVAAYPIGRLIDAGHGRAVMTAGAALGALMLVLWSRVADASLVLPLFVGVGLAQAASLYEPAFAVIARRPDIDARVSITQLTLWGGFASAVFIPLTQALLDHGSWRDALLGLSILQLVVAAALNALALRGAPSPAPPALRVDLPHSPIARAARQPAFWALGIAFTLYYGAFSALALHLYPLLIERGLSAATVVLVLTVIGPAQVLGRVLLWKVAGMVSIPIVGLVTLASLAASLVLLALGGTSLPALLAFAAIYGGANGVMTIVRGLAVPEMVSREAYGALNGLLAAPAIVAKAVAPVAAAWLWASGARYDEVLDTLIGVLLVVLLAFAAAALASTRAASRHPTGNRASRRPAVPSTTTTP